MCSLQNREAHYVQCTVWIGNVCVLCGIERCNLFVLYRIERHNLCNIQNREAILYL